MKPEYTNNIDVSVNSESGESVISFKNFWIDYDHAKEKDNRYSTDSAEVAKIQVTFDFLKEIHRVLGDVISDFTSNNTPVSNTQKEE